MDIEKLKQWLQFAQKVQGGDFWNTLFESDYSNEFTANTSSRQFQQSTNPYHDQAAPQEHVINKEFPHVDLYMKDKKLIVIFELPGLNKEDVHLSVTVNTVVIRGTTLPPLDEQYAKHTERYYGPFERKVLLPAPCNDKNITAKFLNGLLIVSFTIYEQPEEMITID